MENHAEPLIQFKPEHTFFVGIDSDGCVFDSMELKNKECFIPNIIKYWDLQAVSKYARETGEFVNLYSHWRGTNRFPALIRVFDLLEKRPEIRKRGFAVPKAESLRRFIHSGVVLGNPSLEKAVRETRDPVLERALEWSLAVNRSVGEMVKNVPPFPLVVACLEKLSRHADIVVVSGTPGEALRREWAESGLSRFASVIAGQEMGKKEDHIRLTSNGRYAAGRILMIGDAPGDMKAAHANGALFYPIIPGLEEMSWERFHNDVMEIFLNEQYTREYEKKLIDEFNRHLPETPPWENGETVI